jgi:hypothetical protein
MRLSFIEIPPAGSKFPGQRDMKFVTRYSSIGKCNPITTYVSFNGELVAVAEWGPADVYTAGDEAHLNYMVRQRWVDRVCNHRDKVKQLTNEMTCLIK